MAAFLLDAFSANSFGQSSTAGPKSAAAHSGSEEIGKVANPMDPFARMLPGEWKMTVASGASMYHTWHWGPGQRSMRVMIDGQGANGSPWHGVDVYYWHPGRKQVCTLGLSPYAEGVNEGTFQFDGQSAESVSDLYQTGRRRSMGMRWKFEGPDKYRAQLLESTGPNGLQPLVEWDLVRIERRTAPHPTTIPAVRAVNHGPSEPSARWKAFEPLLGKTWETVGKAAGEWGGGADAGPVRTSFEWIPDSDDVYVRVTQARDDGTTLHLLDGYLYYHDGAVKLRCLALSNDGGVMEGDVVEMDGGALQLDLKRYEGDRVAAEIVQFGIRRDGVLQQRIWSNEGGERKLLLELQYEISEARRR